MDNFDLGRTQKSLWGCNCEENFHTFTKRIIFHCFPTFYKFRWQCDKYKENLIIKCTFFFFRFVIKCLIPHCERQLRLLHEIVSNRKTRSLFSGAKRWFGQPKPGANFFPVKKIVKGRNLQGHWTQIDTFQTNNFMIEWNSSQKPIFRILT